MTALRIGWASPWHVHSAIAAHSVEVVAALTARGHRVSVLRTETGETAALPPRPAPGPLCRLVEMSPEAMTAEFDLVVAQIGDHLGNHGALPGRLDRVRTVGVFHDAFIANLFGMHAVSTGQEALLQVVPRELYGAESMPEGEPFGLPLPEMARRRPMLEWLARECAAGVAHAEHYAERLRAACDGPVAVIPLAYVAPSLPPPPPLWPAGLTVAVLGHANENKRVDQVMLAIAASPLLRHRVHLRVIGPAEPHHRASFERLAGQLGMRTPEITGWVSDDEFVRRMRDVDVVCCLRNPVLEGASASVVTALASARPVLVTDHGCYAELPRDAALFCRPEAEALDVMRHLESFLTDPTCGMAIGERGRTVACARHAPEAYADALLPLLQAVVADAPRRQAREKLTELLGGFGLARGDPAVRRASAAVDSLGLSPEKVAAARRKGF